MGKRGLGQGVAKHKDPTFEKVLGNFRREARALQEKKKAADAFSCIKALRFYLKMNGYERLTTSPSGTFTPGRSTGPWCRNQRDPSRLNIDIFMVVISGGGICQGKAAIRIYENSSMQLS